jgi:hypothetical protein
MIATSFQGNSGVGVNTAATAEFPRHAAAPEMDRKMGDRGRLSSASPPLRVSSHNHISIQPRKLLCGKRPVHELFEEGVDERPAVVLVVEIVGVFPQVAGEQRVLTRDHRQIGVRRRDDPQAIGSDDEPDPAAAE